MLLRSSPYLLILCALSSFPAQSQGTSSHPHAEASVPAPATSQATPLGAPLAAEADDVYIPNVYATWSDLYIFGGVPLLMGAQPPELVRDPAFEFFPVTLGGLIIGRAENGPLGPFDLVLYLMLGTYKEGGKSYVTAKVTQAWASNGYCGPKSPIADACIESVFKWDRQQFGCDTLSIFEATDLKSPVLVFKDLCKVPFLSLPLPNTTYIFPKYSAIRLLGYKSVTPIFDGPNIVNHVLMNLDLEGSSTIASFRSIDGPASANLTQCCFPIGAGYLPGSKMTFGYFYISPLQQSF
eukprot:jgi/Botrbrau1/5998/Bobra.104_1s0028.1